MPKLMPKLSKIDQIQNYIRETISAYQEEIAEYLDPDMSDFVLGVDPEEVIQHGRIDLDKAVIAELQNLSIFIGSL